MELPNDVLALVREFSRPRVTKEARDECRRAGDCAALRHMMVTPQAIQIVRDYNNQNEKVRSIYALYCSVSMFSAEAELLRKELDIECPILWRHVRILREKYL